MRRVRIVFVAAAVLVAAGANRAEADPITLAFDFVASGFGTGAPVDPVTGSFVISFENAANLIEQTRGITVSNLNIALDSPPAFAYGAVADVLVVSGLVNGAQTLVPGTNDFLFGINNASTSPSVAFGFIYSQAPGLAVYRGGMTLTPAAAPVPEPATLTLLAAGGSGALLRRRRRRIGI
jgi:hypothetical protein